MNSFDQDISLTRVSASEFQVQISDAWQVNVGPNGGYIAAILLHATKQRLVDTQVRSFNCHFLSASVPGPATVSVSLEKSGRTISTVTAKLRQADRTIALAVANFANSRDVFSHTEVNMPVVPAPDTIPKKNRMNPDMSFFSAFRSQYDQRLAIGPLPPAIEKKSRVGGWTRFAEPRPFDDLGLLAISDSWYPSIMSITDEAIHAPTIDHTVHFLHPLPLVQANGFVLVSFQSEIALDGYLIEDGFIWSESGTLLARSRQLAIILERSTT